MPATGRSSNNGLLKAVVIVVAGLILAGVAGAWSLNERVTRNETRADGVEARLERIERKLDRALLRLPVPPP